MEATSFYGFSINDNTVKQNGTPERSRSEVAITTLDDTNVLAQEALCIALKTAVDNITLGVINGDALVFSRDQLSNVAAASTLAQRENKWLFRYHSVEANPTRFTVTFGTADLTKIVPHTEFIDLTAGVGLAMKTAFEAVVVSPDDPTIATILDSIQYVGRNS